MNHMCGARGTYDLDERIAVQGIGDRDRRTEGEQFTALVRRASERRHLVPGADQRPDKRLADRP